MESSISYFMRGLLGYKLLANANKFKFYDFKHLENADKMVAINLLKTLGLFQS
jgi:hypothetical protein